MSELEKILWWRFFAELFTLNSDTPMSITDAVCDFMVPCHEDWAWAHQPHYVNDNRR